MQQHWGGTLHYRKWWWPFWVFERWSLDTFDNWQCGCYIEPMNLTSHIITLCTHFCHLSSSTPLYQSFVLQGVPWSMKLPWPTCLRSFKEKNEDQDVGGINKGHKDRWPAIRSTVVSHPQLHWFHILQMTWRRGAVVCNILQRKQWYMKLSFWAI
jgi:hypothetical protein